MGHQSCGAVAAASAFLSGNMNLPTGLQRLTLELGGNDAGIVLDDADPAAIAGDLFWGASLPRRFVQC